MYGSGVREYGLRLRVKGSGFAFGDYGPGFKVQG